MGVVRAFSLKKRGFAEKRGLLSALWRFAAFCESALLVEDVA